MSRIMRLDQFSNAGFDRGASRLVEAVWIALSGLLFSSWLPGSRWRSALLRAFGARIGRGVVIKPGVRIKFPLRLSIGDNVWLGEAVWIDNLVQVKIGSNSCISQGAYLCTGSHDWTASAFNLIARPITVGSGCWIGAHARVAPGTIMGDGAVLVMGAFASGHLDPGSIYLRDGTRKLRKSQNQMR